MPDVIAVKCFLCYDDLCCKEEEGGVNLPSLFMLHLEVTQTSFLHMPQLANTEKGNQEQSTEG